MVSRILKLELALLCILTLTSFITFYYYDLLPDNFFFISSSTTDLSVFSYYLASLVITINYYSGPWLFFPFFIFIIMYSFIYSKRSKLLDLINVLLICFFCLCCSKIIIPSFIGGGLLVFIEDNSSVFGLSFMGITSFIVVLSISFNIKNLSFIFKLSIKAKWFLLNIKTNEASCITKSKIRYLSNRCYNLITLALKGYGKESDNVSCSKNMRSSKPVENNDFKSKISINNHLVRRTEEKVKVIDDKEISGFSSEVVMPQPSVSMSKIRSSKKIDDYKEIIDFFNDSDIELNDANPDVEYFEKIIDRIEKKLLNFKIDGKITDILKGPVVDTFLLELGYGVKASKVLSISDDLSGALYGAPIRIVYPMKGRTAVGIEVPRNPRETILLNKVLSEESFKKSDVSLPLAMGKDAYGQIFTVDLASMPHMLVAGATGAGKSVFINTILVSLLVKRSPTEMKLILIDPKQLELALYAKLPHLIMPVITDAKTASLSLMWAVQEMERRYSILKEFGVRNLDSFNNKLKIATPDMLSRIHNFYDGECNPDYKLPFIVIIVDEFADLILTKAGKEIENNICRLAGKARAAGIHMVIATQRPSVDVITGLIKSNFPTRVSFRVTTGIDSRTILSALGAEKLLGKGDMLYKRGVETTRVHSSYVDENDIAALVERLEEIDVKFNQRAMSFLENGGDVEDDPYSFGSHISVKPDSSFSGEDVLYKDALNLVIQNGSASASMLQRRLSVGYNRAAKLIESLEENGVVGPGQGSKPRKVLITSDSI